MKRAVLVICTMVAAAVWAGSASAHHPLALWQFTIAG
jgi:hypothetical protein